MSLRFGSPKRDKEAMKMRILKQSHHVNLSIALFDVGGWVTNVSFHFHLHENMFGVSVSLKSPLSKFSQIMKKYILFSHCICIISLKQIIKSYLTSLGYTVRSNSLLQLPFPPSVGPPGPITLSAPLIKLSWTIILESLFSWVLHHCNYLHLTLWPFKTGVRLWITLKKYMQVNVITENIWRSIQKT